MVFDLAGKVALVVGGAGHLGRPVADALLRHGADVVVASRDRDRVGRVVRRLGDAYSARRVVGLYVDLGDESSIDTCVRDVVDQFGRLDVLVNAAFYSIGKTIDAISGAEFDQANHVHITGSFLLARAAAEAMCDGGSIVQYVSMYGLVSPDPRMYDPPVNPNPIEYGVAKAGLCQMVRYMAATYGPRGIRVNAIAPGPMHQTQVTRNYPGYDERFGAKTMLGRIGRCDETAGAVVFLASEASSYVTAAVIPVDGGWTAW